MQTVPAPAALRSRAEEINCLDTSECEIDFLPKSWRDKVLYAEVGDLVENYPDGHITRQHLFRLGQHAVTGDAGDRRRLLVGTLMWGYGPKGGRSYTNANKVLKVNTLDRQLEMCTEAICKRDVRSAYRALDGLAGYKSGYFTKYLYFLARDAIWDDETPKPLILDSRVESTLDFIAKALDVRWDKPLTKRSAVARYLHYCDTARSWAADLGLEPGVHGAERIEQFLFTPGAFCFDVYDEMRALARAVLSDCVEGTAGSNTLKAKEGMEVSLRQSLE
jgi:hypothetical protein